MNIGLVKISIKNGLLNRLRWNFRIHLSFNPKSRRNKNAWNLDNQYIPFLTFPVCFTPFQTQKYEIIQEIIKQITIPQFRLPILSTPSVTRRTLFLKINIISKITVRKIYIRFHLTSYKTLFNNDCSGNLRKVASSEIWNLFTFRIWVCLTWKMFDWSMEKVFSEHIYYILFLILKVFNHSLYLINIWNHDQLNNQFYNNYSMKMRYFKNYSMTWNFINKIIRELNG